MPCLSDFRQFYAQFVVKDSSTGSVRLQFSKNASFVIKEGTDIVRFMCKGGGGGEYNHVWVKKKSQFSSSLRPKMSQNGDFVISDILGHKKANFPLHTQKKGKEKAGV